MSKALSIVKLYVDGEQLEISESGGFIPGGTYLEYYRAADGHIYHYHTTKPSTINVDISTGKNTSPADILSWDGNALMLECYNGEVYSIANARVTKATQYMGSPDGKISVEFTGDKAEPM